MVTISVELFHKQSNALTNYRPHLDSLSFITLLKLLLPLLLHMVSAYFAINAICIHGLTNVSQKFHS